MDVNLDIMNASEKLCLKWNDFQESVTSSFGELRSDTDFTDVTLACDDGTQLEAHIKGDPCIIKSILPRHSEAEQTPSPPSLHSRVEVGHSDGNG